MYLHVPGMSHLKEFWSKDIRVKRIPFKVRVTVDKKHLKVFLKCIKSKDEIWSHAVFARFDLFSFQDKADERRFAQTNVCDQDNRSFGGQLIDVDDLFSIRKHYVQNNMITIKVLIQPANPDDPNASVLLMQNSSPNCEKSCCIKKRITISNIDNLQAVRSPIFQIQNWQCSILVLKSSDVLALQPTFKYKPESMICSMSMHVTLISSKPKTDITKIWKGTITPPKAEEISFNMNDFEHLMDPQNEFVEENTIVLEVEFSSKSLADTDAEDNAKRPKLKCAICLENLKNKPVSSVSCGHMFCTPCITRSLTDRRECPTCRTRISLSSLRPMYLPL